MIRVTPKPEPGDFDAKVRGPGQRLLKEFRGDPTASKRPGPKRKPVQKIAPSMLVDYWTHALSDLAKAFDHVCAYACVRIDPVTGAPTVDHFKPKESHPDDAYAWENFRYACKTMNTRKGTDEGVCDPFSVTDGDFVLNLVTFALSPNPRLSPEDRARVEHTISKLGLDTQPLRDRREAAWKLYADDPSPRGWTALQRDCPLVAREYVRQRGAPSVAPRP